MPPATTVESKAMRLSGIEVLRGLTEADLKEIEQTSAWRRYASGEQILDRDSDSRDVFFVVEGQVEVVNFSPSGREVAYATVPAGGFFGELSAIDGEPRSANVVADKNCLLASLPPERFRELLQKHGQVSVRVLTRLARIIRICDDRIMDLSTLGAVQRVYQELLRMAKPDPVTPGSWLIYPLPRQHEIASRASTTRETVARVLGHLVSDGLITRKEKTVYLNDRAALKKLIEKMSDKGAENAR